MVAHVTSFPTCPEIRHQPGPLLHALESIKQVLVLVVQRTGFGPGHWGRLARRDVWLVRQTHWKVIARAGDNETGKVLRWEFETEQEAMLGVDRLLRAGVASAAPR